MNNADVKIYVTKRGFSLFRWHNLVKCCDNTTLFARLYVDMDEK